MVSQLSMTLKALVDAYRVKTHSDGQTAHSGAVCGAEEDNSPTDKIKPKDSRRILRLVVYKKVTASHIHHSRIYWFSRTQAEQILQALCLSEITDRHIFEILPLVTTKVMRIISIIIFELYPVSFHFLKISCNSMSNKADFLSEHFERLTFFRFLCARQTR